MTDAAHTVSGPGVDRSYPGPGAALSAAIYHAQHTAPLYVGGADGKGPHDVTYYVRDHDGEPVARATYDAQAGGSISVYTWPTP